MRLLPTLFLFSGLAILSPNAMAVATCPGAAYACSPLTISATISLEPDKPESPVVIYVNNRWGGTFGESQTFGNSISSNTRPPSIDYFITFGTLNLNSGQVTLKGASSNPNGINYSLMNSQGNKVNYTVAYMGCQNDTYYNIAPSITLPTNQIQMAGINPICHPDPSQDDAATPGNGAGKLTFTLSPPPYTAGDYTDTFTLTACASAGVCN